MTDLRHEVGRKGEEYAAEYMAKAGYRLLERNYRCRLGELDIIAEKHGELVFVEVRTKRQPGMFSPEESITRDKARRLVRLAEYYLATTNREDLPWRIDVIAVELAADGEKLKLEHYSDATAGANLE